MMRLDAIPTYDITSYINKNDGSQYIFTSTSNVKPHGTFRTNLDLKSLSPEFMWFFQNYHRPAYAAIRVASLGHTPLVRVIQITILQHQMTVHQVETPGQKVRKFYQHIERNRYTASQYYSTCQIK